MWTTLSECYKQAGYKIPFEVMEIYDGKIEKLKIVRYDVKEEFFLVEYTNYRRNLIKLYGVNSRYSYKVPEFQKHFEELIYGE